MMIVDSWGVVEDNNTAYSDYSDGVMDDFNELLYLLQLWVSRNISADWSSIIFFDGKSLITVRVMDRA